MNGYEKMMRALNDLDPQYLMEAEGPRPLRRTKVRTLNTVAAIVLAFAIVLPVGAYATGFLHPENVDFYLEGVEADDQTVKNIEMENQDLKLTLDAQMSDGHNVMQVYTYEAKSERGENEALFIGVFGAHMLIQYQEGSESEYYQGQDETLPRFTGMDSGMITLAREPDVDRFQVWIPCQGIDLTKTLQIDYYVNLEDPFGDAVPEKNSQGLYNFRIAPWLDNEVEGFGYVTDFAPNVPVAVFHNEAGEEIHMSTFELWSDSVYMNIYNPEGVILIREDGERVSLQREYNVGPIQGLEINLGCYLNPEEYSGIEVGGTLFQK